MSVIKVKISMSIICQNRQRYIQTLWLLLHKMNFLLFADIGYRWSLHIEFNVESIFRFTKYHFDFTPHFLDGELLQ